MLKKVEAFIRQYNMIESGDHVVIGVSGGADSVCLLDVLDKLSKKLCFSVTVVHINHMIRGAEADSDENYVYISGGDWNVNEECDWITATKESGNRLTIKVTANTTVKQRNGTVDIVVGGTKETITVQQDAKVVAQQSSVCPDYIFTVTDQDGKTINYGDSLSKGTIIKAVIENPSFQSNIGWKRSNCDIGNGNKNEKMKNITITGEPGSKVVFSYGDLDNGNLRKRFVLYVKK